MKSSIFAACMKPAFLVSLLVLSLPGSAQEFIGEKQSDIINKVEKNAPGTKFLRTDSTLIYTDQQADTRFDYNFDSKGKCKMEIVTTSCKSCFQKQFDALLADKKYSWKKINGNQWVSKFRKKLLLETEPEPSRKSYRTIRTSWTRKSYKLLNP